MPIYMDLHIVPGVNPKDVAEAHSRDVYLEKDHNCKCLTYWIDDVRGHVFCLIDAPDKESVFELHSRSHGLVPHKIIEVQSDFVESFLGRITDLDSGQYTDTGLLMLTDSSYRIILRVNTQDTVLLHQQLGLEAASAHIQQRNKIIRAAIQEQNGKEVLHEGKIMIGSFITAEKAVACALNIHTQMSSVIQEEISISIHAGEPVAHTDELFGDTLQLLQVLSWIKRKEPIVITAQVKELLPNQLLLKHTVQLAALSFPDEQLLVSLLEVLEKNYADNVFHADDYAQILAMSKSQLYRKITTLTGFSPNELLQEYRLEKATERLRKKKNNVSEVAFETGFSSPSYFTKCFKRRFGLLPLTYQELA